MIVILDDNSMVRMTIGGIDQVNGYYFTEISLSKVVNIVIVNLATGAAQVVPLTDPQFATLPYASHYSPSLGCYLGEIETNHYLCIKYTGEYKRITIRPDGVTTYLGNRWVTVPEGADALGSFVAPFNRSLSLTL
jgi:hypothetical protein